MYALKYSLAVLSLSCFLSGCANSSGKFRKTTLNENSPLVQFAAAENILAMPGSSPIEKTNSETISSNIKPEALEQLEDLVEENASKIIGRDFDFPSFKIEDIYFIIVKENSGSIRKYRIDNPNLNSGAVKYLMDHTLNPQALKHPNAKPIEELITRYLNNELSLEKTLPVLRELEKTIFQSLELTIEDTLYNQKMFDTHPQKFHGLTQSMSFAPLESLGLKYGFDLSYFCGKAVDISLHPEIFRSVSHAIKILAHEFFHGVIMHTDSILDKIKWENKEDKGETQIIIEAGCDYFGEMVLEKVKADSPKLILSEFISYQIKDTPDQTAFKKQRLSQLYFIPPTFTARQHHQTLYQKEGSTPETCAITTQTRDLIDKIGPYEFAKIARELDCKKLTDLNSQIPPN